VDLLEQPSPHETYNVNLGIEHAIRQFQKDPEHLKRLRLLKHHDDQGRIRRDVIQAKCLTSVETYVKTLLWIRPKEADEQFGRRPVQLNQWKTLQNRLYALLKKLRSQGDPMWIILLKARQQGASTMTAAILYAIAASKLYERILVVGHSDKNAAELLRMYQTFHTFLPEWMRPMTRQDNRNELSFQNPSGKMRMREPGLGSIISIDTARDTDAGAGYTVTGFHGSEVARSGWRNATTLFSNLNQAMPQPHINPNTVQVLESTAEGEQGWFYDTWKLSERGESAYTPLFVGFWEEPTYCFDDTDRWVGLSEKQVMDDLDDRESKMIEGCSERYGHDMTAGQLAWRRWMIPNYCEGSPDVFDNQYPWCPEVAFRSSGVTVFDPAGIAAARAYVRDPMIQGVMEDPMSNNADMWKATEPVPKVLHLPDGDVKIYTLPEEGVDVVAIHDASDGYPDSDMQASQFFAFKENSRPEQVAVIECKRPLHEYVDQAYLLGRYYESITGKRVLHVPDNKEQKYVSSRLLGCGAMVYIRQNADKVLNLMENKYGFLLTKINKPKARQALARVIAKQRWLFHDKRTLDQIQQYVVVNRADGTIDYEGAPRGIKPRDSAIRMRNKLYDDLVDGCMILAYIEMDAMETLAAEAEGEREREVDEMLNRLIGSQMYEGRKALDPYKIADKQAWRH